jgi:dihydroflavonol-4-reductase
MILITGATGHIGNVLVRELLSEGETVRAVYAPGDSTVSLDGLEIEKIPVDILDYNALKAVFEGVDTVYHLAGIISIVPFYQKRVYQVNVEGTKNVLRASKEYGIKRLVYVSSIHAFEDINNVRGMDETYAIDPEKAGGAYGKSKAMATLEVEKAVKDGLNAVIVCPTGVIGPNDYKLSELGHIFRDVAKGQMKICVHGTFDFVDVRDVAKGIVRACKEGKTGERYILGGTQTEICDLVAMIERYANRPQKRVYLPYGLCYVFAFFAGIHYQVWKLKPKFTTYSVHTVNTRCTYSSEKAKREIGYVSRPIDHTVKDTLEWLRSASMI